MAQNSPARHWCFTLNNPEYYPEDVQQLLTDFGVDYAVYQLEEGEQGTVHFQGYLILPNKQRLSAVRHIFDNHAHWEVARGTPEQNTDYCTKEEGRIGEPTIIGEIPPSAGRGRRSDLIELHTALKNGLDQLSYRDDFFSTWIRYPNLIQNYKFAECKPRSSQEEIKCTLVIGPPGTGKSRYADYVANSTPGGVFRHSLGLWFDGYVGQRTVIFDDFRGNCLSFTDFKRIIDRYPLRVQVKGSSCEMGATQFFITTNIEPESWWKEEVTGPELSAIYRRITDVIWMPELNKYHHFSSYSAYRRIVTPIRSENAPLPQEEIELSPAPYLTQEALQEDIP